MYIDAYVSRVLDKYTVIPRSNNNAGYLFTFGAFKSSTIKSIPMPFTRIRVACPVHYTPNWCSSGLLCRFERKLLSIRLLISPYLFLLSIFPSVAYENLRTAEYIFVKYIK
jgi:hypothetical protein